MPTINRRQFLKRLSIASNAIDTTEPHVLVCVFLRGGADTLNMIIPYADDHYYKSRPTIAIPKPGTQGTDKSCVKVTDFYGFHPEMKPLVPLFHQGRMGILQAVGTDNTSGSHFEAQDQIEHGEAYRRTAGGGWLGRYLASLSEPTSALSAIAIGRAIPESLRGAPSASAFITLEDVKLKAPESAYAAVKNSLAQLYAAEMDLVSSAGKDTLQLMDRVQEITRVEYRPSSGAEYPDESFAQGLKQIARLTKAEVGLKVACIDLDGWDTHFVQGGFEGLQAGNIRKLAQGLAAFQTDLSTCSVNLTTTVITEFGRRIYENSSLGTDHGRGFSAIVIGNKVKGGKVLGVYPGLEEEPADFLMGPSGLKVKYDYRSLLSEVLAATGAKNISKVFPDFSPQPVGLI